MKGFDAMRLLVTGTSGFVGRHLYRRLCGAHEVWCLNRRRTGVPLEVQCDLSFPINTSRLPRRLDAIIHSAACLDPAANWPLAHSVNVAGTQSLAEWAVRCRVRRFVYLSTGGVYGPSSGTLSEGSPTAPEGVYPATKFAAERAVVAILSGRVDFHIARLFFPYGPGQQGRLIPRLAASVREGRSIPLQAGTDGPRINPLHIADLVEQLARLLNAPGGGIVNLAGPEVISLRSVAIRLGEFLGRVPIFREERNPTFRDWVSGIERSILLTGHIPRIGPREGLADVLSRPGSAALSCV